MEKCVMHEALGQWERERSTSSYSFSYIYNIYVYINSTNIYIQPGGLGGLHQPPPSMSTHQPSLPPHKGHGEPGRDGCFLLTTPSIWG